MSATHVGAVASQDGFNRPLGNLETFFKSLSDSGKPLNREHWTIHFALRLNFPPSIADPAPHLRRAWQILRLQHPTLGAVLREPEPGNDSNRASLSAGPLDLEEWANDTFTVSREYAGASELFPSLYSTPTATCYWLPAASELVIRSSHWRIDGVGIALLGHEFMTALAKVINAKPDAPLEDLLSPGLASSPPVPPSLEDLAKAQSVYAPSGAHQEDPVLAAGADELVGIFLRGVPSIGLPTRESSAAAVPGASERVATRLDPETTARVAAACREKGIKVTSAVHAAIVRVTARFPQHPLSKAYAAFVPVDLRRALDETATPETAAVSKVVGLYFSGLPLCVESVFTKGFEDVARDLAAVYARDLLQFWQPSSPALVAGTADREVKKVGLLDLAEPYVRRTTALFNAPVPEGLPPVQTPDLSSLGRMETSIHREYGDGNSSGGDGAKVQVVDFWVGTEMLTRNVQFHVWSWDGAFRLGACFNTSFYDKEFVADVLDAVIRELLTGCGISSDDK
ncbi:hypothetical protein F4859DRAFT_156549 [Xylaria cf. heliscus]|nr:hypothetical protein F4859DRAFT_156549 [Xylaria cf. heliscus]